MDELDRSGGPRNCGGLLAEFSAREQFGGDRQAIHSSVSSVVERMGADLRIDN